MTFPVTLGATLAFVLLGLFCRWRGGQPPDLVRGPRLAPYGLLMVVAVVGALICVVHLVNLMGFTTGRP